MVILHGKFHGKIFCETKTVENEPWRMNREEWSFSTTCGGEWSFSITCGGEWSFFITRGGEWPLVPLHWGFFLTGGYSNDGACNWIRSFSSVCFTKIFSLKLSMENDHCTTLPHIIALCLTLLWNSAALFGPHAWWLARKNIFDYIWIHSE